MHILDSVALPGVRDHERLILAHSKRHVEHRPLLGVVDLGPGEHGLDLFCDLGFLRYLDQMSEPVLVDLGVREIEYKVTPVFHPEALVSSLVY